MVYVVVLLALVAMAISAVRVRRITLRRVAAYTALQRALSEAVEGGRAVHISLGASGVGEPSTLSALAGLDLATYAADRALPGDKPPSITTSNPVTLVVAQDRLRRAYAARNRLGAYRRQQVRYLPEGERSLALAAVASLHATDNDAATTLAVGRFGPELALLAENIARTDRDLIAQSDQIEGQAIAYAVSEPPLIGEELYVGAAYTTPTPLYIAGAAALDALRYGLIVVIIVLAVLSFAGVAL